MANPDGAQGFVPVKTLSGRPWEGMVRQYTASDRSGDSTNNHGDIYVGTVVKLSAGKVLTANSGDTPILGVAIAFGTGKMHGEGKGYFDPSSAGAINYAPLATASGITVAVVPADDMLFEAQTDAALSLVSGSQSDIGATAGTAHGSSTTGQSTDEIVTTSNNDIEVVETPTYPDGNDNTLANARHLVQFVNRQHA